MNDKSSEVIKNLSRLTNDRNISQPARKKILDAVRHIRELQQELVEGPYAAGAGEDNE